MPIVPGPFVLLSYLIPPPILSANGLASYFAKTNQSVRRESAQAAAALPPPICSTDSTWRPVPGGNPLPQSAAAPLAVPCAASPASTQGIAAALPFPPAFALSSSAVECPVGWAPSVPTVKARVACVTLCSSCSAALDLVSCFSSFA